MAFDGARFFPAPKLRMLDRVSQFALVAAAQAVRDADLVFDHTDRQRAGVFIGTGMGGAQTTDDGYFTLYAEGSDSRQALQRADGHDQRGGILDRHRVWLDGTESDLFHRLLLFCGGNRRSRAPNRQRRGRRR